RQETSRSTYSRATYESSSTAAWPRTVTTWSRPPRTGGTSTLPPCGRSKGTGTRPRPGSTGSWGSWATSMPEAVRRDSTTSWEKQTFGDILALEYGSALPERVRTGKGYPVYGSNGEVGRHSTALVPDRGIVVGRKGTVGGIVWSDGPFWPI